MALRALLLRQQINAKEAELANLRRKEPDMNKREKDLADAIDEAQTDDDRKALEDLIDEFEKDRDELQKELDELSTEIEKLKQDLKDEEDKQPKPRLPLAPIRSPGWILSLPTPKTVERMCSICPIFATALSAT